MAPIAKGLEPAVLVAVEDLVPRLAGDPELGAQRRHLLALKQAGDKPESLVHDVTLLPRHAPSWGAECHPSARNMLLPLAQEGHQIPQRFPAIRLSGGSVSRMSPTRQKDRTENVPKDVDL